MARDNRHFTFSQIGKNKFEEFDNLLEAEVGSNWIAYNDWHFDGTCLSYEGANFTDFESVSLAKGKWGFDSNRLGLGRFDGKIYKQMFADYKFVYYLKSGKLEIWKRKPGKDVLIGPSDNINAQALPKIKANFESDFKAAKKFWKTHTPRLSKLQKKLWVQAITAKQSTFNNAQWKQHDAERKIKFMETVK